MNYWELRKQVIKIIPRMTQLDSSHRKAVQVQEKGRKKNYSQFNLKEGVWKKQERLLNTEEINSFLEISIRAAACPMPFNMDIWDGLVCPFACIYCFANTFRASLYTAFFDNSKTMGFRHCNPDYYRSEIDKMLKYREYSFEDKKKLSGINKAFALNIPIRLGIRFEDFLKKERRDGISLNMLEYLRDIEYPVMINTKSSLIGTEPYVRALADNPAKSAVHVTLISNNQSILDKLEPGAPPYTDRLAGIKNMVDAGIRVVVRIEPYLFLINDHPDDIDNYIRDLQDVGVKHITFDTYSYTANNKGIRQSFINAGYDYDRMFTLGCDSQPLGSLLLGKFIDLFRDKGFSCSTFDMGNVPYNNQDICCEVGDWFDDSGFNYGCTVYAARFIQERGLQHTTWNDFTVFVEERGGFLTDDLKKEVHELWNLGGNVAYSHKWAEGLTPIGRDENGIIWNYEKNNSRELLLRSLFV
jgi:DNA repair photolyase